MDRQDEGRSRTMRYSVIEGSLWAVMYNVGLWFLTPFAVAMQAPIWIISALNSVPPLLDGVAQKIGSRNDDLGWPRKKVFFWGVLLQSVSWLGLSIVAFAAWKGTDLSTVNFWMVFFAAAIYLFGGVINPSWFALMGDVVPEQTRASWFGYRSRVLNAAGLCALLAAGAFINYCGLDPLLSFAGLFFVSFAARIGSAYFVSLHHDPNPRPSRSTEPGPEFGRYSKLLFLLMFSISLGAPYIAVFALENLKFSYIEYTGVLLTQALMYVVSYQHWGRLIDRYGAKNVLVAVFALNTLGIGLWAFVSSPLQAILVTMVGGMLWSGIAASMLNYVYESVEPRGRIRAMGRSSLLSGLGMFAGTIAGGALLSAGEKSMLSFQALFLLAAFVRLAAALSVHLWVQEVRVPSKRAAPHVLMARIITIYPVMGLAYDFENMVAPVRKALRRKRIKT